MRMTFNARYSKQDDKKLQIGSSQGFSMKNNSLLTQMEFASGILTSNLKKSIKLMPDFPRHDSLHDKKSTSEVSGISIRRNTKKKQYEKLKRNNIEQIFEIFRGLPPNKDVELCRLYSESDEPEFLIDKTLTNHLHPRQPINVTS
jgi:neutral trehalase